MRLNLILVIKFIFLLVSAEFGISDHHGCPTVEKCRKHGPEIRFPFRLKGRPQHCGFPGFELSCSESKETLLENPFPANSPYNKTKLPYQAQFIVENIYYGNRLMILSGVEADCLAGLFPHLNFSGSLFKFRDKFGSYPNVSLYSCPSPRTACQDCFYLLPPISCLSTSGYHVYANDSYPDPTQLLLLSSCTKFISLVWPSAVLIMPYGFPATLFWDDEPKCGRCEREGKYCRLKNNSSIHQTECFPKDPVPDVRKERIKKVKTAMKGLAVSLSAMGLVMLMSYYVYSLKNKKEDQKKIERFLEDYKALRPTRYTYADIKKITDQLREKLGQGGYGTVYKGKLSSDVLVAVKLLDNVKGNGEEFINEVGTIGRIHHVNVVRLVGYCADGYRRALVYEFLPNESLEKFISSGRQSRNLGWEKLQQIAVGIAKGLDYLHQGCSQRILHFDIKPHNILLDHNFNPKVADFGLAKLCSNEQSKVSVSAARGTIGYIAPEVFSRNYGNVSCKADIYSYGMLLIDMVGGRKNDHPAADDESEVFFPEWLYNQLEKGEEIAIQIEEEEDNKIYKKLIVAGLWCIQWYPTDRPSMKAVIQMIEGDDIPKMPPNPFASTRNAGTCKSKLCSALEIISEED